jgi:hypothetical protein
VIFGGAFLLGCALRQRAVRVRARATHDKKVADFMDVS